jgi:hypothetical protein
MSAARKSSAAIVRVNARLTTAWLAAHESACRIEALARLGANAGDHAEKEDLTYLLASIRAIAVEIKTAMEPIDHATWVSAGN